MEELNCSFCGRKKPDTQILVAGIDAHICEKCVDQAIGIIQHEKTGITELENFEDLLLKKPKEIKSFLDDYVGGQEIAKIIDPDLTAADMDAAVRTLSGSARSAGIEVEG